MNGGMGNGGGMGMARGAGARGDGSGERGAGSGERRGETGEGRGEWEFGGFLAAEGGGTCETITPMIESSGVLLARSAFGRACLSWQSDGMSDSTASGG